jgi:hypothetical protein
VEQKKQFQARGLLHDAQPQVDFLVNPVDMSIDEAASGVIQEDIFGSLLSPGGADSVQIQTQNRMMPVVFKMSGEDIWRPHLFNVSDDCPGRCPLPPSPKSESVSRTGFILNCIYSLPV